MSVLRVLKYYVMRDAFVGMCFIAAHALLEYHVCTKDA